MLMTKFRIIRWESCVYLFSQDERSKPALQGVGTDEKFEVCFPFLPILAEIYFLVS